MEPARWGLQVVLHHPEEQGMVDRVGRHRVLCSEEEWPLVKLGVGPEEELEQLVEPS